MTSLDLNKHNRHNRSLRIVATILAKVWSFPIGSDRQLLHYLPANQQKDTNVFQKTVAIKIMNAAGGIVSVDVHTA